MKNKLFALPLVLTMAGCMQSKSGKEHGVRFITLDPGHFHAALVQKSMYPDTDTTVWVYAPKGKDVELHLEKINAYNRRDDNPTTWKEEVYLGDDYLEKMLSEKKGNVVVLAGNNKRKMDYIGESVHAGLNVLADKPMAINKEGFEKLKAAFKVAEEKEVLLYDIMTERYEITTILQKEFSMLNSLFGTLEKGTVDNPAVTKESVHYFYKHVSGSPLVRPVWFMDVEQEGEGIVDVTTHLVDLVQWECFPEQVINYQDDIQLLSAIRSSTDLSLREFSAVTKSEVFPDFLKKDVVQDSILQVYANGEINYRIKGVHAKVSVKWGYRAPEGTGDTHYSIMRGSRANLIIRQGAEEKYKPQLYIEPVNTADEGFESILIGQLKEMQTRYPGIAVHKTARGWWVSVPEELKEGHERHFERVTNKFLQYLQHQDMPHWEVPNMIAKYYVTTSALELAKGKD
ncbi:putative oxidoreductase C-terminal domain-containing protein [Sphingobacterium sp. SYP-B4668]|uniref:putative oxidoreductase C-terminal domain-containing protein n=1 Tax=Sphingobacterium sp. SYP-B4668 TaxID=2996035 RepID=UPI0022DE19D5|nr:putative oxidoreductase C-terminal domain-containing protein [Sphingobacterium sp. SYP-B4668]